MVEFRRKRNKRVEKGSGRKIIKAMALTTLWDDLLEVKSYNTFHGMYKHNEEVPRIVMSGKIFDISQLCKFDSFKWVIV